jgi:anti-sigma regulatory factor (Ser/Thr protein kinase)
VKGVAGVAGGGQPRNATSFPVALSELARLRDEVQRHARECGLPEQRVGDLVLIANELTSNVVRHGGGTGRLALWCSDTAVYCEVSDRGTGIAEPERAGRQRTSTEAFTGRGLWMIRQLGDEVHIESGPDGTTIRVALDLRAAATSPGANGARP